MSDEASGPEDDTSEVAVLEWKQNMAVKSGISGRSDAQLIKASFFETIKPNWRSDEVSFTLHFRVRTE